MKTNLRKSVVDTRMRSSWFILFAAALVTLVCLVSVVDKRTSASFANIQPPNYEGFCTHCLLSNGTWGVDIDCNTGTNICTDRPCLTGAGC
jgi:hypothetical protein